MAGRPITDDERRARLGRRQVIEPGDAATVAELTDRLVVLHATDPATIYLSVGARRAGTTVAEVDEALFVDRTIYRTMAMRRTLFVVSPGLGPSVEGSSAPRVAATERKRLVKFIVDTGIPEPEVWLNSLIDEVMQAMDVDDGGAGRTARELTADVPRLSTKLIAGLGTRQETELAATSRVLGLMAVEGLVIRGRPSGSWTTRQYRWHRRDRWWPDGAGPRPVADERTAAAELLGRYLARFGPATLSDLVWWTGWTKTLTRAALAGLDVADVVLGGGTGDEPGLILATDLDPVDDPGPWAALLPALDPTPMGWKQRDWYLGPHREPLFDRNGNIGPTVWVDGRIVGGWAQRPDGEVVTELLEEVGADHRALIEAEVAQIGDFVGDVVVKPSFPTPLQRELSSP